MNQRRSSRGCPGRPGLAARPRPTARLKTLNRWVILGPKARGGLGLGMDMDNAYLGLIGVVIGASITWIKDAVSRAQERKRDAAHLAAVVSTYLDSFAEDCADVAGDNGTYRGELDEHGCRSVQIASPTLNLLSITVQWRALPPELLHQTLEFPNEIHSVSRMLESIHDNDSPPYDDFFAERRYEYAKLGLKATDLSSNLRKKAKLPTQTKRSVRTDNLLRSYVKKFDATRRLVAADREASHKALNALLNDRSPSNPIDQQGRRQQ